MLNIAASRCNGIRPVALGYGGPETVVVGQGFISAPLSGSREKRAEESWSAMKNVFKSISEP